MQITGETPISEIVDNFPQVVDYLIMEYDFHCVNCFISSFENFEEGARVHGIADDDFEMLLIEVNGLVAEQQVKSA